MVMQRMNLKGVHRREQPGTSTPRCTILDSSDCGRAGLVDEWLQVRNALSIEIFSQDHPLP
jgi:hypothetical protein